MKSKSSSTIISANPTKQFIVHTITKDIRTEAAIYDLIDNSINAAEKLNSYLNLNKYTIDITINKTEFKISDNCGGISKYIATGNAFKLGSTIDYDKGHGIGMKRAFLKFGKLISINNNTLDYPFKINLNVDEWGIDDNWDIKLIPTVFSTEIDSSLAIMITSLYPDISKLFSTAKFISALRNEISIKYRYILRNGLTLKINGTSIIPKLLCNSKSLKSETIIYKPNINVQVILHSDVTTEDNGWDIIINNRVILFRDKSDKTQWRKNLIKIGHSYENFVGEVFINCENVKALPLWTTKDEIDYSSETYLKILNFMYSFVEKNREAFKKSDISIQYKKPYDKVEKLKNLFDANTAKEVGERSFENAYLYAKEKYK